MSIVMRASADQQGRDHAVPVLRGKRGGDSKMYV
jgi:hypothetical protein